MTIELLASTLVFSTVVCLALIVLAAHIACIVRVGRDARERGLDKVWVLQVIAALQFPWVALMYYLVTRAMDARTMTQDAACTLAGHGS